MLSQIPHQLPLMMSKQRKSLLKWTWGIKRVQAGRGINSSESNWHFEQVGRVGGFIHKVKRKTTLVQPEPAYLMKHFTKQNFNVFWSKESTIAPHLSFMHFLCTHKDPVHLHNHYQEKSLICNTVLRKSPQSKGKRSSGFSLAHSAPEGSSIKAAFLTQEIKPHSFTKDPKSAKCLITCFTLGAWIVPLKLMELLKCFRLS